MSNKRLKVEQEDNDVIFVRSSPRRPSSPSFVIDIKPNPEPQLQESDLENDCEPLDSFSNNHQDSYDRSIFNAPLGPIAHRLPRDPTPLHQLRHDSPRLRIAQKQSSPGYKSSLSAEKFHREMYFNTHWSPGATGQPPPRPKPTDSFLPHPSGPLVGTQKSPRNGLRAVSDGSSIVNRQVTQSNLTNKPPQMSTLTEQSSSSSVIHLSEATSNDQSSRDHQNNRRNFTKQPLRVSSPNHHHVDSSLDRSSQTLNHNFDYPHNDLVDQLVSASTNSATPQLSQSSPTDQVSQNEVDFPSRHTGSLSNDPLISDNSKEISSTQPKKNGRWNKGKYRSQNHRWNQGQSQARGQESSHRQKRKRVEYQNENIIENSGPVFETLDNNEDTVSTADLDTHLQITTKIVLSSDFSDMVELSIGETKVKFRVNKDLLSLHSPFFRDLFAKELQAGRGNKMVQLEDVNPIAFRFFYSWLGTGKLMSVPTEFADVWALGDQFGIASLQNCAMQFCLNLGNDTREGWPDPEWIEHMYELSQPGSALRQFAAHSVVWYKPFEKHPKGTEKYQEWKDLVEKDSDLALDMSFAAGKDWNGGSPWDDTHRATYILREEPLANLWDEYILSRRSRADLERAAKTTCFRSRIELQHLNREK